MSCVKAQVFALQCRQLHRFSNAREVRDGLVQATHACGAVPRLHGALPGHSGCSRSCTTHGVDVTSGPDAMRTGAASFRPTCVSVPHDVRLRSLDVLSVSTPYRTRAT